MWKPEQIRAFHIIMYPLLDLENKLATNEAIAKRELKAMELSKMFFNEFSNYNKKTKITFSSV